MTFRCPCCGQPVNSAVPPSELQQINLTNMESRIVKTLADAYPRRVPMRDIIEDVYHDHPKGGPYEAKGSVRMAIMAIRPKLEPHGWRIPNNFSGHGTRGTYCLEPIDDRPA